MMQELKHNLPATTHNVAHLLKNENGKFLVQRGGQSAIVQAKEGHSITSWEPIGAIEPTVLANVNLPYTVSRINEGDFEDERPSRSR